MTDQVDLPEPTPEERELGRKIAELAALEELLAEKEHALAKLEGELHVFEIHYLSAVGKQYAELDAIEADIAELEAGREPENADLLERAEITRARAQESADALQGARSQPERRAGPPSEGLKQLFRKVARLIHPDLAEDAQARAKRRELMAAANHAYETGDETQLASILKEWEESPEAVVGQNAVADLLRAIRQIARAQERIKALDREIAALKESEFFHLRDRVEEAEAAGRDLLSEMAASIEPHIRQARARLQSLLGEEAKP